MPQNAKDMIEEAVSHATLDLLNLETLLKQNQATGGGADRRRFLLAIQITMLEYLEKLKMHRRAIR